MSRDLHKAGGAEQPDRRSHHISSIAHLFLADDKIGPATADGAVGLQMAVTCLNDSRIAAYATGGLVDASRDALSGGAERSVQLVEDAELVWSARAFLRDVGAEETQQARRVGGQWAWSARGGVALGSQPVCWTHLRATHERKAGAAEGCHGLIVCLLAAEVGRLSAGLQLGRLLGQFAPSRLEILVFPDNWATGTVGGAGGRSWFGRSGRDVADVLGRCQDLTRAIAGICPVAITNLPPDDAPESQRVTASIVQNLAQRLTSDFWVDPPG